MATKVFTEDDVKREARQRYGKPICIDMLREAMACDDLESAVMVIMLDSAMWDSPTGNPFDLQLPNQPEVIA